MAHMFELLTICGLFTTTTLHCIQGGTNLFSAFFYGGLPTDETFTQSGGFLSEAMVAQALFLCFYAIVVLRGFADLWKISLQ